MSSFLELALRQRVLVIALACLIAVAGIYSFRTIAIDAFPDVTTVLVQVVTEVQGLSPAEIERFVTFPLELQLTGAPGLTDIRSLSKVGLSMITVVFRDDVDIYLARQLVLERVLEVQDSLPPGARSELVPNSPGLGEVFQFYLEGPHDNDPDYQLTETELMERRTLEDWVIRPLLKGLPDVVDVNSIGGFVKQYQVMVDPGLLRKYDLALHEVFAAVANNNANAGGNILEKGPEKYIVRGIGLIKTLQDIENIVVKEARGTPVYVRDVAEVQIGHAVRHGAAVLNGQREVVAGIILMLRGGNAREVVQAVKDKIEEIHDQKLLPAGLRIMPFYDRLELIVAALHTVYKALLEGIVLVIVVLFLFLGNVRSALIVTATLVVAPLATFIVMDQVGLTANLMSLGGLVIAIGMMVDGSVVVVENVYRHLSEHPSGSSVSRRSIVLTATKEVAQPVLFGILIIILVFLPILSLQGMEGKMFKPHHHDRPAGLVAAIAHAVACPVFDGPDEGHRRRSVAAAEGQAGIRPISILGIDPPADRIVCGGGDVGRQPCTLSVSRRRIHPHSQRGGHHAADDPASQHFARKIHRDRDGDAARRHGVSRSPDGGLENRTF
jgi:cobalt-zinc-cadmium resistance protein CzcA